MASYTTEILPYGLRAKGFTWLNFCVTAALFFNQYINAIALEALAWKYYICYCVFLVFEVFIIYFFIVETRYTPWRRSPSSSTGTMRLTLLTSRMPRTKEE